MKTIIRKIAIVNLIFVLALVSLRIVSSNAYAEENQYIQMIAKTNANVRSGPSTSYKVVGSVKKGTPVYVIEAANSKWFKIVFNEGEAYVSAKLLTLAQPMPTARSLDPEELKKQAFTAVNAHRKSKGLPEYIWSDALEVVAKKRAEGLVKNFSHTSPSGQNYSEMIFNAGIPCIISGENIGYGYIDGTQMVSVWLDSSYHKQMIEDSVFNQTAVGVYVAPNGAAYFAEEFIR